MKSQSIQKKISDATRVRKVEQVKLTSKILKHINQPYKKVAAENSKNIAVFRIEYDSQNHIVVGYIIVPSHEQKLKNASPCLVYNRGGVYPRFAIKRGQLFVDLAKFAREGYVVLASQYSGTEGGEGKDQAGGNEVTDIINLKSIIDDLSFADENRIGMYGKSRGGMMTYRSVAEVNWVTAGVAIAAPANEVRAAKTREGWKDVQKEIYGGSQKEQIRRSAAYWTDKFSKKTPLLVMHGTSDWRVNPKDSLDLSEQLLDHEVPHRLIMYEGGDHHLSEYKHECWRETRNWLKKYVKNQGRLPNMQPHGD